MLISVRQLQSAHAAAELSDWWRKETIADGSGGSGLAVGLAVVAAVLLLQGYLEIRLGSDRPAGWFWPGGIGRAGHRLSWRYRLTKQQQVVPPQ